jgi:hypothetical protein
MLLVVTPFAVVPRTVLMLVEANAMCLVVNPVAFVDILVGVD